jgi:hypothetical protein
MHQPREKATGATPVAFFCIAFDIQAASLIVS